MQFVVAGVALVVSGAITLGLGVHAGSTGHAFCGQNDVCTVITAPEVPAQVISGALLMSAGSAVLGAGWAYLLGTARPHPTSSPESQD